MSESIPVNPHQQSFLNVEGTPTYLPDEAPEILALDNLEEKIEESREITDWFQLACKLKEQNRELIQTVVRLEQTLAQVQQDQMIQQQRLKEAPTVSIAEKVRQSQIEELQQQFEASVTENQNKVREIETLTAELLKLQTQLAQLERECVILDENHQTKTHQLTTAERHIRELHSRLQRQQRYTLEYKTALEQYTGETLELPSDMMPPPQNPSIATPISSRSPIQPWSGQTVPLESSDEVLLPEPTTTEESEHPVKSALHYPSFRINLSKVATQYGTDKPPKPAPVEEKIDLPAFLRRRFS